MEHSGIVKTTEVKDHDNAAENQALKAPGGDQANTTTNLVGTEKGPKDPTVPEGATPDNVGEDHGTSVETTAPVSGNPPAQDTRLPEATQLGDREYIATAPEFTSSIEQPIDSTHPEFYLEIDHEDRAVENFEAAVTLTVQELARTSHVVIGSYGQRLATLSRTRNGQQYQVSVRRHAALDAEQDALLSQVDGRILTGNIAPR